MKFLLPLLFTASIGCNTLTEIEKQELDYKQKFDMTKVTLLIDSEDGDNCLATLVSETIAITSAGCVHNRTFSLKLVKVIDDEPVYVEIVVDKVETHPDYSATVLEPYKNIAAITIKPSKAIKDKYIHFPIPLLFKSSHYSTVKNAKNHQITHFDTQPKISNLQAANFFTNGVALGPFSLPISNLLPGSVSVIKYYDTYMITGMKIGPSTSLEKNINYAALYKSRQFLSKYISL
jgi:hypothetical protein